MKSYILNIYQNILQIWEKKKTQDHENSTFTFAVISLEW